MENNIEGLRDHLFDVIKGIKDKTISIEEAKAISEVAQCVINSAKVEVEYEKVTGISVTSDFIPAGPAKNGITRHRLRG